jgi:hypothetical protein
MRVFARAAQSRQQQQNKQSTQRRSIAIVTCALLSLLNGCSGTNWGEVIEQRVNPATIEIDAVELPSDFPRLVPVYEAAQLIEVRRSPPPEFPSSASQADRANRTNQVFTQWQTEATFDQVNSFYNAAFSTNGWRTFLIPSLEKIDLDRVINQPESIDQPLQSDDQNSQTKTAEAQSKSASFLAQKDDLLVTVSIVAYADRSDTEILLQYVQNNNLANNLASPQKTSALPNPLEKAPESEEIERLSNDQTPDAQNARADRNAAQNPAKSNTATNSSPSQTKISPAKFSDLSTVPTALQTFVKDMANLGAIDPAQGDRLQPNGEIKRRDYARWLVLANNRIYQGNPSRQIRLALTSDQPSFADIKPNDPDFLYIQALANAGLIGSRNNQPLFQPDAPLSREDMIAWKVPLDLRDGLPNSATVATVQQAWNFQDSDRIAPGALVAILGDDQLGDLSNIRRSFGYTTIFQPKKPVTRAEAAAVLWHFGTATDGISAQDILQASSAAASN